MTAFILGNGISRKGIDLNLLKQQGKIYGCNALYREFTPDVLIATDRLIAAQIQESGYAKNHKFYTRRPIEGLGAQLVPKAYFGYSSGPNAIGVACIDGHRNIYLLGFDMGPTPSMRFNNVYAGTEFYKSADAAPTFTGNWIRQIVSMVGDFSNTQFIRVCGPTSADVNEFKNIENFDTIDIKLFRHRLDTNDGL